MAVRTPWLAISLCMLVCCEREYSETEIRDAKEAANRPDEKAEANAAGTEAANAIRRYFRHGNLAAGATSKFHECHDDTKGYAPFLKCLEVAAELADTSAKKIAPKTEYSRECAIDIQQRFHDFVSHQSLYLDAWVAWAKANKSKLVGPMANRALPAAFDVIDNDEFFSSQPWDFDPKFGGCGPKGGCTSKASYASINQISCAGEILGCPPPKGNVCHIDKLAVRLGVPAPWQSPVPGGIVFVKRTGMIIK